ncbi:hypothetical protein NEMBOFW57_008743 [Staphylotrichum longicolle]|uniref:Uncharacterized protein n=1 Tax=Staphylotrichum longicolle TaxID=669026 RepID=A0AAD4EW70_9PEZI|nr:hypothetical protein NEMBOFW57_008743 [Staphylotrichum longicolle]
MRPLSPALDERIELQIKFKTLSDDALELIGTYNLHQDPFLVKQTVKLVENAARWGAYLENDHHDMLLIDAARFLTAYETSLSQVREQLRRLDDRFGVSITISA